MDTTASEIEFDTKGVCNYCRAYDQIAKKRIISGREGEQKLQKIVQRIKEYGRNKEYDCVIGLSGGVDSSFVAYQVKRLGLCPLAIHFDNGWDSEIAIKNIDNIIRKLNFNLYTYTIDWEEFKDLQLSFLKASVVDIEMITDHATVCVIYEIASKNNIKYILGGTNIATEGIMPLSWGYAKWDSRNIKAIQKRFGKKKMDKFPTYSLFDMILAKYIRKIHLVEILNYIDYNREKAKKILKRELGWQDYGKKHYESIFTKFYQAYILPTKFNIDKRKAHLSTLICSGYITREQALEELQNPLYDSKELQRDKKHVLKKLDLSEKEFEEIMHLPVKSHLDYANNQWLFNCLLKVKRLTRFLPKGKVNTPLISI